MTKVKDYSSAPADVAREFESSVPVDDFLPSPHSIAESMKKQETILVTMKLKKSTVNRYKKFAAKKGIKYQTFVSNVLDAYAKSL